MKKIYISGKIAGCEPRETKEKFLDAWAHLIDMFTSCEHPIFPDIINPMDIKGIPNGTWQDYMERDLIYLKHCDAIYMLRDWKDSAGARVEHEFAKKLGLEIIYEEEQQ